MFELQLARFAVDYATIQINYGKKDDESNQQWMLRLYPAFGRKVGDLTGMQLLKDTKIFENIGYFLFRQLIKISKEESDSATTQMLEEAFDTYKKSWDHTNVYWHKLADFVARPGMQFRSRTTLLELFGFASSQVLFYAAMGRLLTHEEIENDKIPEDLVNKKIEELRHVLFPDYPPLPNGRLTPEDNPEEIKQFADVETVPFMSFRYVWCGNQAPFTQSNGQDIRCNRFPNHDGPHVAKIKFLGLTKVLGVWDKGTPRE
ncbi:MAG: hypothetical protein NTV57_04625 [Cyanobacteria bacterium]|nr:hypothetical protein [Cyanobacteriota bacterium]